MSRRRPWRAIATQSDPTSPTGARTIGHASACSQEALSRFCDTHRAAGHGVAVWEVLAMAEVSVTPGPQESKVPVA